MSSSLLDENNDHDQKPSIPMTKTIIKHEAETILMDRETTTRIEMKNLKLENTKLVQMLEESQRKCVELKLKNTENERFMVGVYQETFQCLDENLKLKEELNELKSRYNALAQDCEKLDCPLVKALIETIDQARMEGYTQCAQEQVVSEMPAVFPKTGKNTDKNVDELGGGMRPQKITSQSGNKGLKGSGKYATTTDMEGFDGSGAPVKQQLIHGAARYSSKTDTCGDSHDDETITLGTGAHYVSSSTRAKSTLKRKRTTTVCESDDDDDESWSVSRHSNPPRETKLPYYRIHQSKITFDCVQNLRKSMGIPPEYKIIIPSLKDRPNNPPPGNFVCFFTDQLNGGLRFPIPPLYTDIARLFNISLSQLTPNSFRLMAGFAMAVRYLGEEPTASLFHSYYHLHRLDEGFSYLTSRLGARFLVACPYNGKVWKEHYFFISSPQPWNFPTHWRESSSREGESKAIKRRDPASMNLLDRLNQSPYNLSLLVEPSLLYHFGLSPLRKTLLKPLDAMMVECLMKEDVNDPKRRQENNNSYTSSEEEFD